MLQAVPAYSPNSEEAEEAAGGMLGAVPLACRSLQAGAISNVMVSANSTPDGSVCP